MKISPKKEDKNVMESNLFLLGYTNCCIGEQVSNQSLIRDLNSSCNQLSVMIVNVMELRRAIKMIVLHLSIYLFYSIYLL